MKNRDKAKKLITRHNVGMNLRSDVLTVVETERRIEYKIRTSKRE